GHCNTNGPKIIGSARRDDSCHCKTWKVTFLNLSRLLSLLEEGGFFYRIGTSFKPTLFTVGAGDSFCTARSHGTDDGPFEKVGKSLLSDSFSRPEFKHTVLIMPSAAGAKENRRTGWDERGNAFRDLSKKRGIFWRPMP